eukprot:RCo040623
MLAPRTICHVLCSVPRRHCPRLQLPALARPFHLKPPRLARGSSPGNQTERPSKAAPIATSTASSSSAPPDSPHVVSRPLRYLVVFSVVGVVTPFGLLFVIPGALSMWPGFVFEWIGKAGQFALPIGVANALSATAWYELTKSDVLLATTGTFPARRGAALGALTMLTAPYLYPAFVAAVFPELGQLYADHLLTACWITGQACNLVLGFTLLPLGALLGAAVSPVIQKLGTAKDPFSVGLVVAACLLWAVLYYSRVPPEVREFRQEVSRMRL